jgi:hypothetical protein
MEEAMGQLDKMALVMSKTELFKQLHPDTVTHMHPYAFMPYELAEIEECSLAFEDSQSSGEPYVEPAICQWHHADKA